VVSTPENEALLEQAIAHVNAGEIEQGRAELERVLEQNPKNDRAWVWLSGCVEDPRQRRICLQQALNANPNNQAALDGMQALEGKLVHSSQAPPSLVESRLSAIGMGDEATPSSPPPVSPSPPPEEAAVVSPVEPEPAESIEEPTIEAIGDEEVVKKPRRGRIVLLAAVVLLLFLVVCILVAAVVVLPLLGIYP
jgi:hypothetical protein